jgi:DNA-binding CsgD family transcriptional regulator
MDDDIRLAIEKLTPAQALEIVECPPLLSRFIDESEVMRPRKLISALRERAAGADEGPSPGDPRRTDAERLREFVQGAVGLSLRLRQVANLCLDHGLSLTECATRLGISRNTVRVHLWRLRQLERATRARREPSARVGAAATAEPGDVQGLAPSAEPGDVQGLAPSAEPGDVQDPPPFDDLEAMWGEHGWLARRGAARVARSKARSAGPSSAPGVSRRGTRESGPAGA